MNKRKFNKYRRVALSTTPAKTAQNARAGKVFQSVVQTAAKRQRTDIGNWRTALQSASNPKNPNPVSLYDIYTDASIDALLTSQIENRKLRIMSTPFAFVNEKGENDEEATALLKNSMWFRDFVNQLLDTIWWGHSLFEFSIDYYGLKCTLIPRKHVRPLTGLVLKEQSDDTGIEYRKTKEYGSWLIEAESKHPLGLLGKSIPHILMKRFAQSCWSEFCEIFGMPTRVLKTNTSDPEMLNRAEVMMSKMGANNWAIIDETELLTFESALNGNGEVYRHLITLCNNEISLLNSGAIIGQDTEHGTRGKEVMSEDMLKWLVASDAEWLENYINTTLIPALYKIGYLPTDKLKFTFNQDEDLEILWKRIADAMLHYEVDLDWLKDKFGIPLSPRVFDADQQLKLLAHDNSFFG